MKPIVAMNSSTGIPLSTWTVLKTASAMGGLAPGGWPAGAVWPLAGKALSGPFSGTFSRPTMAVATKPMTFCLDPSFIWRQFLFWAFFGDVFKRKKRRDDFLMCETTHSLARLLRQRLRRWVGL